MIRKSLLSVGMVCLFLQADPSLAEHTWRYNVNELHGEYSYVSGIGELLIFPIDMRKTFTSISSVSVLVKGFAYPGRAVATDGSNEEIELPVVFQFRVADEFVPGTSSVNTPGAQ